MSDRIAFGIQSDRVRNLIGLRSESDQIAFGGGGERWRLAEQEVGISAALSWAFVQPKLI